MRYKRTVCFFLIVLALFAALNYAVWKRYTEALLTERTYNGGDLARLGYLYNSKHFRKNSNDLPHRHVHLKDHRQDPVDVITLGDSFANGGAGGRNRYFQDYIASINNVKVLNIDRYRDLEFITTASMLLNNGFLERYKPRYLLISMAEKGCNDLAGPVDFDRTMTWEEMKRLEVVNYHAERPEVGAINDGNFKFLLYSLLYHVSDHAIFGKVHVGKLQMPMFSVKNDDRLLFFRYKQFISPDRVKSMNDNLNILAERLEKKGITLVFMPCVEKYTLYSDFMVNNRYPRGDFFEQVRLLPKKYLFIDTKAILLEELKRGEKDLFYADDTHWSWKASEKIFQTVRFQQGA